MHFFRPTVKPESDELVSADVAEGGTVLDEFTDDPVFPDASPPPTGYLFLLPGQISPFRVNIPYTSLKSLSKSGKKIITGRLFSRPGNENIKFDLSTRFLFSAEQRASFRSLRLFIEGAGLDPSAHEPNTQLSQGLVRRLPGNHRM